MDNLMLGLKVAAIGIIGVFVVLCILMAVIKMFEALISIATKKSQARHNAKTSAVATSVAPAVAVAGEEDESEVVAVITAAIMAILQSENAGDMPSFTIKKIKQIKRN